MRDLADNQATPPPATNANANERPPSGHLTSPTQASAHDPEPTRLTNASEAAAAAAAANQNNSVQRQRRHHVNLNPSSQPEQAPQQQQQDLATTQIASSNYNNPIYHQTMTSTTPATTDADHDIGPPAAPAPEPVTSPHSRTAKAATLGHVHSLHPQIDLKLNNRFMMLPMNDQIRELQTVIRDKRTPRGNFKFYADRLIRLVVEEGLNKLPIEKVQVKTPTGQYFSGICYLKGNCGVSIVRAGESMEQGLRDCCRSIRIGKILLEHDENNQAKILYVKFPKDIAARKILLLYPIMSTGLAVIESVKVLLGYGVREENLILLNLFSSPKAAKLINSTYPNMSVLTSDLNPVCPNHFGHRYFGTD